MYGGQRNCDKKTARNAANSRLGRTLSRDQGRGRRHRAGRPPQLHEGDQVRGEHLGEDIRHEKWQCHSQAACACAWQSACRIGFVGLLGEGPDRFFALFSDIKELLSHCVKSKTQCAVVRLQWGLHASWRGNSGHRTSRITSSLMSSYCGMSSRARCRMGPHAALCVPCAHPGVGRRDRACVALSPRAGLPHSRLRLVSVCREGMLLFRLEAFVNWLRHSTWQDSPLESLNASQRLLRSFRLEHSNAILCLTRAPFEFWRVCQCCNVFPINCFVVLW